MRRLPISLLLAAAVVPASLPQVTSAASQVDVGGQPALTDADAVAARIRMLESAPTGADRNRALHAVADAAGQLAAREAPASPTWRRLQSDRLYALLLGSDAAAAVGLYRDLQQVGVDPPGYTKPQLASALARMGATDEALALLRTMARDAPADPGPAIRMAYLLSDAGRYPEARTPLLDWLQQNNGSTDEARLSAELALVRIDRWNEAFGLAQERLDRLSAEHANSDAVRLEQATLARQRAQPRRALALAAGIQGDEANNLAAQAWLDLGRPDHAAALSGNALSPDLAAQIRVYQGTRGHLTARYGNSRSPVMDSPHGANEFALAARVDGAPFEGGWRLGAALSSSRAEFRGSTPRSDYAGLRVVRAMTGGESSLEVGRSIDDFLPRTYATLESDGWLSDHFRLAGRLSFNDPESSLQARASGIGSDTLTAAATWRASEAWRVDAGAGYGRFDDGNRRRWGSLSVEGRLTAAQGTITSGFASLYASANTLRDAAYFNPRHDLTLETGVVWGHRGLAGSWQTLRPSVALYREAGFDTFAIPRLSYAMRFPLGTLRWWQWEIAGARPVYDGGRETYWSLSVSHGWGTP
jgi:tetratricopeptide (TPR) repeat protein